MQENLVSIRKQLDIDTKYLDLLGFTQPIYNGTRYNFTIVTYILSGQAPSAILLSQNIAVRLPKEVLLIYNLGLSDSDARALSAYCNNSKCAVITYDLSPFPSYVAADEHMHAFRPLIIKDALCRSRSILFLENNVRLRRNKEVYEQLMHAAQASGVLGLTTRPQAVSSRTHPKMFDFFETDADSFFFLPMVSMDMVIFLDTKTVNEKILLPWIRCTLIMECIHPIGEYILHNIPNKFKKCQYKFMFSYLSGAQSGGCRYNKKPQYRYSGCHAYDASAFNIVLGLQWNFDESKYSKNDNSTFFYRETLEEATKNLENKRRNISDISDRPFTDDN